MAESVCPSTCTRISRGGSHRSAPERLLVQRPAWVRVLGSCTKSWRSDWCCAVRWDCAFASHMAHCFVLAAPLARLSPCPVQGFKGLARRNRSVVAHQHRPSIAASSSDAVSAEFCCLARRRLALQLLLHVVTSSQHFSHFFRHVKGLSHVTHTWV